MEEQNKLGRWLEAKCKREHLALREAGNRAGLSHTTIAETIGGQQPTAVTISKLAKAFSDNEPQRLILEDKLLALAGYRTEEKAQSYLDIVPLLSSGHQRAVEGLVRELANLEGIDTSELGEKKGFPGTA